jgi:hypothetical protein
MLCYCSLRSMKMFSSVYFIISIPNASRKINKARNHGHFHFSGFTLPRAEHGPIPRYDTDGKFRKSTIYHGYCCQFVSIVQCIRTSGTIGKIWLRIVKVSLPSVNQGPLQLGYLSKGCRMVPVLPLVR